MPVARRPIADSLPSSRLTSAFERRVGRVLERNDALRAPLVVAVSGGPDSTALLVAAARARSCVGELTAAYFDHGMRPATEIARDRAHVRAVAGSVGAHARSGGSRSAVPLRTEAAARDARYGWLATVCHASSAIVCATGHTLDDQAETVLLRLTRGTGLTGAAGMAEDAAWPVAVDAAHQAAIRVVRPLLGFTREDVLDYLDALGLQAREDETNALLTFDRNRVRHRVLSELRRINPRAAEQLARFAAGAREDDAALTAWALDAIAQHTELGSGSARFDRAALRALPVAVSSRALRLTGARLGMHPQRAHVEQLLAIAGRRGARVALPSGGDAETNERWLELRSAVPRAPGS